MEQFWCVHWLWPLPQTGSAEYPGNSCGPFRQLISVFFKKKINKRHLQDEWVGSINVDFTRYHSHVTRRAFVSCWIEIDDWKPSKGVPNGYSQYKERPIIISKVAATRAAGLGLVLRRHNDLCSWVPSTIKIHSQSEIKPRSHTHMK